MSVSPGSSLAPIEGVMRIDDELFRDTCIKRLVRLRCLIERDDFNIHRLGDVDAIVKDCHHQAAVVLHHGCLTRRK